MTYRWLAGSVVIVHLGYLLWLAAGSLLAWRRPRLVWLHLPAVAWALLSLTVRIECPLTDLEKYLSRRGGEPAYRGGFIDHYLTGVVYPAWASVPVAVLVALAIAGGYVRLTRRDRHDGPGRTVTA